MNPFDEYHQYVEQYGFDRPEPPQKIPLTDREKDNLFAIFGAGVVCGVVFLGVCAILLAHAIFFSDDDSQLV